MWTGILPFHFLISFYSFYLFLDFCHLYSSLSRNFSVDAVTLLLGKGLQFESRPAVILDLSFAHCVQSNHGPHLFALIWHEVLFVGDCTLVARRPRR